MAAVIGKAELYVHQRDAVCSVLDGVDTFLDFMTLFVAELSDFRRLLLDEPAAFPTPAAPPRQAVLSPHFSDPTVVACINGG